MEQIRTPWTAQDYYPFVQGEGARKLADSGVAPLLAVARGYKTIQNSNLKESLSFLALSGTTSWGRKLKQLTPDGEDVLYLPWYNVQRVFEGGTNARTSSRQVRPSQPLEDPTTGKVRKYEFLPGTGTVLDAHPSTPTEWIESSPTILFTEGVLKGDSALTALMLDAGISVEDLAHNGLPGDAARMRMQGFLLSIPPSKRVTIISFAGVANWRNQPEWRTISLKDRDAWVAFDGDVRTNPQVWKQASDLWSFIKDAKHGKPSLIDFDGAAAGMQKIAAGLDAEAKVGLDDYLTRIGSWEDVEKTLLESSLPPQPERVIRESSDPVGEVRVTEDGAAVEQFKKASLQEISMGLPAARWEVVANVGGRVISVETRRVPAAAEVESGEIDRNIDDEQSETTCEIEISWFNDIIGDVDKEIVRGPANLLSIPPKDWHKHASIPPRVQRIPAWPPQKGAEWLQAIKANRQEETNMRMAWDVMGWVPVENGHPAFIVGNDTLVVPNADAKAVERGVNDPGSSKFGVIDVFPECKTLDEYKEQVRADIRAVVAAFLDSDVWLNKSMSAAVVASMLRPTLPLLPHAVNYLYGPPRSGKTWTAGAIMSGWNKIPGTWSPDQLPGQATDTKPAIERDLSRHPIWVADDLPPSVDKRKAENDEAKIGEVIRAVHNGSGRRKMNGEGGVATATPRALFIITAENEPTVPSVRDRVLLLNTPPKETFGSTDQMNKLMDLAQKDGAPARLTAHMVRYWLNATSSDSWASRVSQLRETYEGEVLEACFEHLQERHNIARGEATRHGKMASDLALSFLVLGELALWAGIPLDDPIVKKCSFGEGTWVEDVFELAAQGITRQRDAAPGATLVECVAGVLRLGKGHLLNPADPGQPPFQGDNAAMMNRFVGWAPDPSGQGTRPMGDMLGYVMTDAVTNEQFAIFTPDEAFSAAQRQYPNKILYGQNAKVAWDSVWAEGLTFTARARRDGRNPQFRIGAKSSIRAVPVRLDALVKSAEDE